MTCDLCGADGARLWPNITRALCNRCFRGDQVTGKGRLGRWLFG